MGDFLPGIQSAGLNSIDNSLDITKKEKAKKAAAGFEQYFIAYMLKEVGKSIGDDGPWGSGMSGDIYSGMLFEEFAKSISERGGLGLADMIGNNLPDNNDISGGE